MLTRPGRHKIFLGMAAGVGKTYRMLQEGQAEAEAGRDVVIGYLETHGRTDTIAQADHLHAVPRRRVVYRDTVVPEMDLPAILHRAPELCLVDELAHTNAPGLEHPKRYEDVADVLTAGIDVYSTVNVQHLESVTDRVTRLTGTRVRETLPDAVLSRADDVVLIDITPESLIERLIDGKVYPSERIQAALNNFFKVETLSALREISLRQVAKEIEPKPIPARAGTDTPSSTRHEQRLVDDAAPQVIGERLLALVTPRPQSQRIVRRASRSAERLGAELDILWVSPSDPSEQETEQLAALRLLASVLGAHLLVERGDDVALVARRVARERGTTYVLMGTPALHSALRRLASPPLPLRLVSLLPGIDLRIVADRSQREMVRR
jgi:two-component system, OmpR family, sensor histidine kinase KdpD